MKAFEISVSLFWLAFSIFVMIEGARLGVGSPSNPGMGFMPFWAAAVLAGLALSAAVMPLGARNDNSDTEQVFGGDFFRKVIPTLAVLVIYALTMPIVGFLLGTFLLLCLLFRLSYHGPLWHIGLAAFITSAACHLLFQDLLRTQFPRGIFGF